MPTTNPALFTFPRNRDSKAEPVEVKPTSEAPGDKSIFSGFKPSASSITALLTNLGGVEKSQIPELILMNTPRMQIWFDNNHLIEAGNRRATVDKYYLATIGEVTLYRVEDIKECSVEESQYEISKQTKELIDNPADKLTLKHCYTLTQDEGPYEGVSEKLPREMFERDGSLGGYTDPPPIPFVEFSEAIAELDRADEKQHLLDNFN